MQERRKGKFRIKLTARAQKDIEKLPSNIEPGDKKKVSEYQTHFTEYKKFFKREH
jgi:hypothetical protein